MNAWLHGCMEEGWLTPVSEEIAGSLGAPISAPKDGPKDLRRAPAPQAWSPEAKMVINYE